MKLVMTLLVRDEEDIIDWNIRYHLARGVDHFVVTDNLSEDATPNILRRYERAGVLTYIHEPSDDYSQDLWVTRMADVARKEVGADWILHCDADEFWWPEEGEGLEDVLRGTSPEVRVVHVERSNFLGPSEKVGARPFFERMVYRQTESVNSLGRPLPPKVAHRPLEDVYVHQGNHGVSVGGAPLEPASLPGMSILHFPARSPGQLRNKVGKGGAAYARNTRLDQGVGRTWRVMYERLAAGRFEEVLETSFVADPDVADGVVLDGRLRDFLSRI